ncbi:4Fe-4S binding protein [Pseudonocardia sp.]|uniref:4Fe-4S binding protein n=1 Tax=Pseudonocardia sp. TaxID=60912 RepID=UPI003D096B54
MSVSAYPSSTTSCSHPPAITGLQELPRPDGTLHGSRVKRNTGVLKRIRSLTHDTLELTVTCEPGSQPLHHLAGQYATLHTSDLDKPRSYSFAKAPSQEAAGEYTFFVRLVPGGAFSGWLFEQDRTGATLAIAGPLGKFGLDDSDRTIVAIAGGSGMSAIKALLEDATTRKVARDCVFLYGARTQGDLYCQDEIEEIRRSWHPDHTFESVMVLSDEPAGSTWDGPTGFVTDHLNEHYLRNGKLRADDVTVLFCGPPPMVDAGVAVLGAAGVSAEHIRYDKFEDATSPAPVINNLSCVLCDECLLVKPVEGCIVEVSELMVAPDSESVGYQPVRPAETSGVYYNTLLIDPEKCIRCYACVEACPTDAISPDHDPIPQTLRASLHA